MKILFLGTGTSTGVPSLCCDCEVCLSNDLRNKRLRASILIQNEGNHILIDTSTDLRQQCLANGIKHIDSVLYTHHHADHVHGIDELRSFNYFNNTAIPCYGSKATLNNLADKFDYIFNPGIQLGGGLPRLNFHTVDHESFMLEGVEITPLDIQHGTLIITGYKLNNSAYITDCSGIPEHSREKLRGLDLLILNALGFTPHPTHYCLSQALAAIEDLQPKRALLTHINHKFDHETVTRDLPENVELAIDGMCIDA